MPPEKVSISLRALSLSTVKRISLASTVSPSALSHSTSVPSSMVHPKRGIAIASAMRLLLLGHQIADGPFYVLPVGRNRGL